MCIMCLEIQKDKMKAQEVFNALKEFTVPKEHEEELFNVITDKYGNDLFQSIDQDLIDWIDNMEMWNIVE